MKNIRSVLCGMLCLSSSVFAVTAPPATLSFQNYRGSVLELVVNHNKITGFFTTAVASKSCPQALHQRRPITGYIIGNALSFSVFYPMCESVLSIVGNLSEDQQSIDTLSILNKQAVDVTLEGPGARLIGHDTYQAMAQ